MSLREQIFAGLITSGRSAGPGEHGRSPSRRLYESEAPAVFIGASPMKLLEPKRRARARVLPETAETLTREV